MDDDSHVLSEPLDRLSELPNSLILKILSLLEMGDAVRTSILSKRWKDLWTTVPCLDFWDESLILIEGALARWKGTKILKFSVYFSEYHPSSCDGVLDSWLLVPIDKQVEDLYLNLGFQMDEDLHLSVGNRMDVYCPPQRLYSCSSLTKLLLGHCNLKIVENVQWNKLKSLTIEYPYSLSDDAMNRILSGAPLLEELILCFLDISEDINMRSTSLKMLEIGTSVARTVVIKAMLKIWAPNLLRLEISGQVYANCLLHVPSLTNATLVFEESCEMSEEDLPPLEMFHKMFRSISHAEKVTLSSFCIQFLLRTKEEYDVITFPNTKFLKFSAREAKGMLDVLEMFPQLITLKVELHDEYPFKCEKSEVDAFQSLTSPALHQLKAVEIGLYTCNASILPAIEILLHNAPLLEKMVVRPKWYMHWCDRVLWLNVKEKVLSMPRSSTTAKIIAIV